MSSILRLVGFASAAVSVALSGCGGDRASAIDDGGLAAPDGAESGVCPEGSYAALPECVEGRLVPSCCPNGSLCGPPGGFCTLAGGTCAACPAAGCNACGADGGARSGDASTDAPDDSGGSRDGALDAPACPAFPTRLQRCASPGQICIYGCGIVFMCTAMGWDYDTAVDAGAPCP